MTNVKVIQKIEKFKCIITFLYIIVSDLNGYKSNHHIIFNKHIDLTYFKQTIFTSQTLVKVKGLTNSSQEHINNSFSVQICNLNTVN